MGHSLEHHLHNNQAVDNLVNLLTKASHDLTLVQHKLEKEFQQIYPDNANPIKLVSRIKKLQQDLSSLKEQCRVLLAAKQDLIDKARTTLVGNRSSLQRLQASTGIPVTSDSDDPAYTNFNQVIYYRRMDHSSESKSSVLRLWAAVSIYIDAIMEEQFDGSKCSSKVITDEYK
ncbi:hypothetical protein HYC85_004639 [Camellia sinensis]|uniref:Protein FAM33A n=1 Tax=Camellia sinensis TaxID=4442 RepID=A0A7J7HZ51_CAMSI|nr:hypothetical protein HYC85_004639 [Camellia sinensis]